MSAILDVISGVESIISKFIPDPKLAAEAQLALLKLQMTIPLAEASSQDKWTSRARPAFLYVMYIMILFCIPIGALFAFYPDSANSVIKGMQLWLAAIPKPLWDIFGLCFSVYAIARTHEKQPFFGGK